MILTTITQLTFASTPPKNNQVKPTQPHIEVCFVLDTTGSMGGLIEAAKQKIWSIANQIVKSKPSPELKIGLVAYRDRGDEYVTKPFPLTNDIDTVYAHLTQFVAAGGGDEPESVNEALAVAVHKMEWSSDSHVLKIIFLVGDAPPHMDYPDDVKYPVTCEEAATKGIIINSVQCGAIAETTPDWQKIAKLAEGRFIAIGETGDVAVIATPMDKKLAELNVSIGKTLVPYGKTEEQNEVLSKQKLSESSFAATASAPAASDRLAYNVATGKAVQGDHELVADYESKPDTLKKIDSSDLPAPLQKMKPEEVEAYLKQQATSRKDLQNQISELSRQRDDYLANERKKLVGRKDSFDEEVAKILAEEAAEKGLVHQDLSLSK